jgi:hypothetical protein
MKLLDEVAVVGNLKNLSMARRGQEAVLREEVTTLDE